MAVINTVPVHCTNKLCTYKGTSALVNETYFTDKKVCPKCGFKTLGFGNDDFESVLQNFFDNHHGSF